MQQQTGLCNVRVGHCTVLGDGHRGGKFCHADQVQGVGQRSGEEQFQPEVSSFGGLLGNVVVVGPTAGRQVKHLHEESSSIGRKINGSILFLAQLTKTFVKVAERGHLHLVGTSHRPSFQRLSIKAEGGSDQADSLAADCLKIAEHFRRICLVVVFIDVLRNQDEHEPVRVNAALNQVFRCEALDSSRDAHFFGL